MSEKEQAARDAAWKYWYSRRAFTGSAEEFEQKVFNAAFDAGAANSADRIVRDVIVQLRGIHRTALSKSTYDAALEGYIAKLESGLLGGDR